MKFTTALTIAAASQLAAAHTTVWSILVNGKDAGVGNKAGGYIDSPPNNNPVTDVTSSAMTCNVPGVKASTSVSVKGGDKIGFQWWHNGPNDDVMDRSHMGPIMVYASKAGSSLSWTKLAQEGLTGGKWAVDKMLANKGVHEMTMPNLAPGDYVLRPEIIALHEGNRKGGAQFYMECVHVKVTGSGTAVLPAGVSIPGAYKAEDPGVLFDIYSGKTSYPIPGPAVWNGAASSANAEAAPAPAAPAASAPATTQAPVAAPAPAAPVSSKKACSAKTTLATMVKPTPTAAAGGAGAVTAQSFGQCGGNGFTGATACGSGWTCKKMNDYYSQCVQ